MLIKHEQSSISYFFMLHRAHHTEILFCVTLPVSGSLFALPYQDCTFSCLFTEVPHPFRSKLLWQYTYPSSSQLPSPSLPFLFLGQIWWNPSYATVLASLPNESRAFVLPFCVVNGQNSSVALKWWRTDEAGWENKFCYKSGVLRR